ncbi:MAG: DUF2500 domain-containing protein [Clostridia bacterium]|nr:DUF2500 domain-containing protein [Clostridia bacterium]
MDWEAIRIGLMMLGGAMGAILLLMLVAKVTSMVNVEAREGRKPVYNMEAVVKGKRTLVEADTENPAIPKTRYFVTFHKRDGNRIEMEVPGEDYGLAAEGDEGILVYQGDEFIVFKRIS